MLQSFKSHANAWLKLVIEHEEELEEADELVAELNWPKERVMLMPQGTTFEELRDKSVWLARACTARGVALSPRLHVMIWGNRRGV